MKLKQKDLKQYREKLAREQGDICALCGTKMEPHELTLDHCHETGHCRRVLHRSCNQSEGRILSWIKRSRAEDPLTFIENLVEYWVQDYSTSPVHPTHLTEQQKQIKKLKRKLKVLKTERGKQRVRDKIKQLQEQ